MFDALPRAVATVSSCTVRDDFARLQPMMEQGASLAEAVAKLHFQGKFPARSFVTTGEGSGSLPEMLLRFADLESEAVANFQVRLADWLPRLFYFGVAGWMAYQILNQHVI
jgi:general secretion pathway protein F